MHENELERTDTNIESQDTASTVSLPAASIMNIEDLNMLVDVGNTEALIDLLHLDEKTTVPIDPNFIYAVHKLIHELCMEADSADATPEQIALKQNILRLLVTFFKEKAPKYAYSLYSDWDRTLVHLLVNAAQKELLEILFKIPQVTVTLKDNLDGNLFHSLCKPVYDGRHFTNSEGTVYSRESDVEQEDELFTGSNSAQEDELSVESKSAQYELSVGSMADQNLKIKTDLQIIEIMDFLISKCADLDQASTLLNTWDLFRNTPLEYAEDNNYQCILDYHAEHVQSKLAENSQQESDNSSEASMEKPLAHIEEREGCCGWLFKSKKRTFDFAALREESMNDPELGARNKKQQVLKNVAS